MPTTQTAEAPGAPKPVDNPLPEEANQLTPEEVHELRRAIQSGNALGSFAKIDPESFIMPKLPILESDADAFADALMEGTQYSESFSKFQGKLRVKFRVRSRREEEELLQQLNEDFKAGMLQSEIAYRNRTSLYNLVQQTLELDGVELINIPGKSLRENAQASIFDSMPEPKIYILVGLLSQFENKVSRMARQALDPDFSAPAAAI